MTPKTVLTLVLAALVLFAGVAAAQPAASADDASNDQRQGPPDALPGPVPDFVGNVLNFVQQQLAGGELGEALSDLLGGDAGVENAPAG